MAKIEPANLLLTDKDGNSAIVTSLTNNDLNKLSVGLSDVSDLKTRVKAIEDNGYVSYNSVQTLDEEQCSQAQANMNAPGLSSLILLMISTPNFLTSGVPASISILSRFGNARIMLRILSSLSRSRATCRYGGFHNFIALNPIIGCVPLSFSANTLSTDGYPSSARFIASLVAP